MLERINRVWLMLGVPLLILVLPRLRFWQWNLLPDQFLVTQDLAVLLALVGFAAAVRVSPSLAAGLTRPFRKLAGRVPSIPPLSLGQAWWACAILAASCLIGCRLGAHWIYDDYALTMDEYMARFGAMIVAHGQLVAPVDPQWRTFADALSPRFLARAPDGAWWTSAYLPVNSALRGLGIRLGAEALVSPLLAAVSILALFAVGRKVWPDRGSVAICAVALLVTSSQFLVTAMTPYAMTAHLAFNLVWLWLFLRDGWSGRLGAIVLGFFATGLHQLLFHPLFVAPFVLELCLARRWRPAALYTAAYALICLFWIDYWRILAAAAGPAQPMSAGAVAVGAPSAGGVMGSVLGLISSFNLGAFDLMAKNLIRFVTWQNPLLPPLCVLGIVAATRTKGTVRALGLGLVLTVLAMLVILPDQGHGWGYRYLHGLLGSACLLAAWAWSELSDGLVSVQARAGARLAFAAAAAASLLLLFPLRAWQFHAFAHPYAVAQAMADQARTPFVVVDDENVYFGCDVVRNDPYLRARPLKFCLRVLTVAQVRELCARGAVTYFGEADAARAGVVTFRVIAPPALEAQRQAKLKALTCGAPRARSS